jgi:hypothetical protein
MKKEKSDNPNLRVQESTNSLNNLPGYPIYPESEDIYNIYLEEKDINPENLQEIKKSNEKYNAGRSPDIYLNDEFPIDELDVPGSELDDDMESIGSEDEENNYYSLGGDAHDDLEEDQGE